MLAPGLVYDPNRHPLDQAPLGDVIPIDDFESLLSRRSARDGTPYCACCNTTLRPQPPGTHGKPKATCTACSDQRRRKIEAANEQRRRSERRRAKEGRDPWHELGRRDVENLSSLIDKLTYAVGNSSSEFREHDQGTWQHTLLLTAKELIAWRNANLATLRPTDTEA